MLMKYSPAFFCAVTLLASGCRDDSGSSNDLGVSDQGNDESVNSAYTAATPYDIDSSDPKMGRFVAKTAVRLTGLVITTPVNSFSSRDGCKYEVWAQDPQCTKPPCGIAVIQTIPTPANKMCPETEDSGTFLATSKVGDNIDVSGTVDIFPDISNKSMVVEHEVLADSIKASAGEKAKITPLLVDDGALFVTGTAKMTPAGWATYEATYITLKPHSDNLTITKVDPGRPYHFHTTPGNTDWGDIFRSVYNANDAGVMIRVGAQFKSISGVVTNTFGGAILPVQETDFVLP
jgi:hypothetical protein